MSGARRWRVMAAAVLVVLSTAACAAPTPAQREPYPRDDQIRLDQVQLLGTHNSYHLRPASPFDIDQETHYEHAPLDVQLNDLGMRSFEFDAYNAAEFPVFHTLVLDAVSTCPTLEECWTTLAQWSRRHPGHVPLVVLVEPKDLPTNGTPGIEQLIEREVAEQGLASWDAAGLDRLDALARKTFGKALITPNEVRGRYRTLREAIRKRGWPTLAKVRGGILVVLNTAGSVRDLYLDDAPSLEGRAMFVTATPDMPAAAFVKRDTPDPTEIERLVRQHFLVRTRADADGVEARAGDTTRATNAIFRGAQVISTDYPEADPDVGDYVVQLPGSVTARCNPVSAPRSCRDRDVENQRGLRER